MQVMKEWSTSFYAAGLVPAAIVYMSGPSPSPGAPVLRAEVAALQVRRHPVDCLHRCDAYTWEGVGKMRLQAGEG